MFDLLLYKNRLYIPPSLLRRESLRLNHDDPLAGHFGYARTLELLRRKYYWPGFNQDVRKYVDTCDICHRIKSVMYNPHGQLQDLPLPCALFIDFTIDFISDMPPCEHHGVVYDSIFVIVDRYTKMVRYIPARMDWTSERLAEAFIEKIWRDKDLPDSVVSDRGSFSLPSFGPRFVSI